MLIKSAVRHPNFDAQIDELGQRFERAREIIDGAVWEITKDPERLGVYHDGIDFWQARLDYPPVLLYYSISRRFVYFIATREWED